MSGSARVTSIERVQEFRTALIEFGKDARDTLCAVDLHLRRISDWLEERTKFWQHEIRKRQEEVVRAKIELESRKNMNKAGHGPGTTDQVKALRKAQARLQEAEDKFACCKRWKPQLQHDIREYQGPAHQLSNMLDTHLVHAVNILAQKLAALEAYLSLQAPSLDPAPTSAGANAGMTSAAAGIEESLVEENHRDTETQREHREKDKEE